MLDDYIKIEMQHINQSVRMAKIHLQSSTRNTTTYMNKKKCASELEIAEYCFNKITMLEKCREILQ